jgi:predicted permease
MGQLLQDVRYATRAFGKAPGFTAVAVIVLALGVGANSAIFSIANALVFKRLPGRAGDLVGVYPYDRTKPDSFRGFSYPDYVDVRDRSGAFDGVLAQSFAMVGVPAGDTTRRAFAALVSANYFDTIGVPLAAGRAFTAAEERPGARNAVAIVGYGKWKEAGLAPSFIGSTIRINTLPFTVVGVAPPGFAGTMAVVAPDVWLPLGMYDTVVNDFLKAKGPGLESRSHLALMVSGTVKSGLAEPVVQARLGSVAQYLAEAYPSDDRNIAFLTRPYSRLSLSTRPQGDSEEAGAMVLFLGLSGAVLLIACLNIANMLLARGTARRKEFALRLALGAARPRLVRQLLTEGFLLALVGSACGLVVSYWSTTALVSSLTAIFPLNVAFDARPDARVIAATLAFAAISTLLFALGPALKFSAGDLVADLKDATQGTAGRRFGARNLLVIGQVALSLALLVAGGLFARASVIASNTTPGFSYDRIVVASIDPSLASYDETRVNATHRHVIDRVRRLPEVEAASLASQIPFGNFHEGERIERVGVRTNDPPDATYRIIGADYFRSLGLRLVRGRDFTSEEEFSADAPSVAIVDMTLAKQLFGNDDPIGQVIRIVRRPGDSRDATPMQIVGIAPPMTQDLTDPGPVPHLYVPFGRNHRAEMHVHIRAARAGMDEQLLQDVRRELRAADPRLPILELKTMRGMQETGIGLWLVRAGGYMFTLLGVLALLLAVVGIYGLRSYVVAQRTREFGIRMALGADASRVQRLVLREGLVICGAGLLIGLPLAMGVAQGIASVLHRIGGLDPLVFAAAPTVLAAAALVASYIPARRATLLRPIDALRSE